MAQRQVKRVRMPPSYPPVVPHHIVDSRERLEIVRLALEQLARDDDGSNEGFQKEIRAVTALIRESPSSATVSVADIGTNGDRMVVMSIDKGGVGFGTSTTIKRPERFPGKGHVLGE